MIFLNMLSMTFLLFVISCNMSNHTSKPPHQKTVLDPIVVPIDSDVQGQYLAVFESLNLELSHKISGAFTFSVESEIDELVMDVRLTNSGANLIHAQNLRTGSRCPTSNDDLNLDGIIDAFEGEAVYGKIFIPLDGDISSQSSHDGEFPSSDEYGNYIYAKLTSFSTFLQDLRQSEESNQDYVKLKTNEPLDIEKRVVVIQGLSEEIKLPETVRSVGSMTSHQSLPIVCGVIKKVLTPPGEITF